jgi:hypothetical protein
MRFLASIAFALLLTGCSYSRNDAERALKSARTSAEERRVFTDISDKTRGRYTIHDLNGKRLDFAKPWEHEVFSLHVYQFGDPPIKHVVIDKKNIVILLGE